jgi:hypothetical protein
MTEIEDLMQYLQARADAVPLGACYRDGPLCGAPRYNAIKEAMRLIEEWRAETMERDRQVRG